MLVSALSVGHLQRAVFGQQTRRRRVQRALLLGVCRQHGRDFRAQFTIVGEHLHPEVRQYFLAQPDVRRPGVPIRRRRRWRDPLALRIHSRQFLFHLRRGSHGRGVIHVLLMQQAASGFQRSRCRRDSPVEPGPPRPGLSQSESDLSEPMPLPNPQRQRGEQNHQNQRCLANTHGRGGFHFGALVSLGGWLCASAIQS